MEAPQTSAPELVWTEPDEEALVGFLCGVTHVKYVLYIKVFYFKPICLFKYIQTHLFREERVRRRLERFHGTRTNKREEREKEKAAGRSKQTRMLDFFKVTRKREQVSTKTLINIHNLYLS